MGLLTVGVPLSWDDSESFLEHVKEHGIIQLLHIWDRLKNRRGDQLLWGDEVRRRKSRATRAHPGGHRSNT